MNPWLWLMIAGYVLFGVGMIPVVANFFALVFHDVTIAQKPWRLKIGGVLAIIGVIIVMGGVFGLFPLKFQ